MNKNKKILVTGSTGFIGSHTTTELIRAGYSVVGVDDFSNSKPFFRDLVENLTGAKYPFYNFNINHPDSLPTIIKEHPDIVGIIHFAANKSVNESLEKPLLYYQNNIGGILNLLTHFKATNPVFVFSSSCTVYGIPTENPVSEKSLTQKSKTPYGKTKQIGEEILNDFALSNSKFNCVCLRYFNPAGADISGKLGEYPEDAPQNLVPYITQTAIGKRESLTIFGSNYDTPDGTCIRDFIHITDLAKAHIKALDRLLNKKNDKNCEVFNLGTGQGVSVLELINTFEKETGIKLNYKFGKEREGDVVEIWANTDLAKKTLGWVAQLDIKDIVVSAWKWEKYIASTKL